MITYKCLFIKSCKLTIFQKTVILISLFFSKLQTYWSSLAYGRQWTRAGKKVQALKSGEVTGSRTHEADEQLRERRSGKASGARVDGVTQKSESCQHSAVQSLNPRANL